MGGVSNCQAAVPLKLYLSLDDGGSSHFVATCIGAKSGALSLHVCWPRVRTAPIRLPGEELVQLS